MIHAAIIYDGEWAVCGASTAREASVVFSGLEDWQYVGRKSCAKCTAILRAAFPSDYVPQ